MKKFLLSLCFSAACSLIVSAVPAPQGDGDIRVTDTEVVRVDDATVGVAFKLEAGNEVTAKSRSLVVRPALVGTGGRSELPPIVIRGERAKATAESRAMDAAGVSSEGRYITASGSVTDYYTQIPWQEWMAGSQLVFSGLNAGKDGATEVTIGTVADNLLADAAAADTVGYASTYTEVQTTNYQKQQQGGTATDRGTVVQRPMSGSDGATAVGAAAKTEGIGRAEELASRFTFVEPVSKYDAARRASSFDTVFDYNMPLTFGTAAARPEDEFARFIEMTRHGALYVKFDKGSDLMGRDLGKNNTSLVELISSIRALDIDPKNRIARIVIVGFSAPEGAHGEKDILAQERAGVVRDFITANSYVDADVISTYNGSVDWPSLRALVAESNMKDKYKVLDIIDNVPAWASTQEQGRMTRLMEVGNGSAFRYIRENIFPQLRQTGAYVKVYYE